MKVLKNLLLVLALLFSTSLAEDRVIPVKFAPGASGTEIVEGVARGETATFTLGAGAGQKMRVSLTSVESNAVFDIIAPNGAPVGSSVEKSGAQVWYGALPQDGTYKVVVGTTRGGAEITISFSIK